MNIVLLIIAILFSGVFLTLRSMKEFLPELRATQQEKTEIHQEAAPNVAQEPPTIISSEQQFIEEYHKIISELKANNESDITIERINLGGQYQFVIYRNSSQSIWSAIQPSGYIVDEGLLQDITSPEVLASQYILRHKYNDVFYVSERRVIREPNDYIESAIDQTIWARFYKHAHNINLGVSTQKIVLSKILGQSESTLRRTG